jgi:hypothetical protein
MGYAMVTGTRRDAPAFHVQCCSCGLVYHQQQPAEAGLLAPAWHPLITVKHLHALHKLHPHSGSVVILGKFVVSTTIHAVLT